MTYFLIFTINSIEIFNFYKAFLISINKLNIYVLNHAEKLLLLFRLEHSYENVVLILALQLIDNYF